MSQRTDATKVDSQPNPWDFCQTQIFFLAYYFTHMTDDLPDHRA